LALKRHEGTAVVLEHRKRTALVLKRRVVFDHPGVVSWRTSPW